MTRYSKIYAYIDADVHCANSSMILVKTFSDVSSFAKDIATWLNIGDISHVYKAIKGKRKHAYKDPETGKPLTWSLSPKVVVNPDVPAKVGQLTFNDKVKREDYNIVVNSSITHQLNVVDNSDFTMIVFSDSHVIPDQPSLASKALLSLLKKEQPKYVACLGDTFDFATISKHARSGWEKRFTVGQELAAGCKLLNDVANAVPNAMKLMTFSNHDSRFNNTLSAKASEFEGVHGFNIKDHIGNDWKFGISLMFNERVILKHQWHNGQHAAWNNVLKSGISIITGHTHKQGCRPYTDYTGTRYGVEVGTLSAINNPMYNYAEHAPLDWISGAVVLTFKSGKLITPEFMSIHDGVAYFRGKAINIEN